MGFRTSRTLLLLSAAISLAATTLGTAGCGSFFVCEGKASCPSSGSGTGAGTGDYAYVSNSSSSNTALSAYSLSTGSPVAISASPISLGFSPNSMVITPDNTLMFASSPAGNEIFAYSISSEGALSNPNGSSAVANSSAVSMDVSPDGKYLFALTGNALSLVLEEFSIGTNGVLTSEPSYVVPISGASTGVVKVAPSADFVVIALGTSGDVIVPLSGDLFNTATVNASSISEPSSSVGDFGVTIDASNNIYFARTGTVAVYSATSNGVPTLIPNGDATGTGDHSILVTGNYVYTANFTDGTISGFSVASGGTLGPLTGSPYTGPSDVDAVGIDNTGKYILAAGYGTNAIQEYSIGTSGALTVSATEVSSGSYGSAPLVMALTH